jgi:hypothetical protein
MGMGLTQQRYAGKGGEVKFHLLLLVLQKFGLAALLYCASWYSIMVDSDVFFTRRHVMEISL